MLKNLPYEPLVKLVTRPLYFHALTITITTLKGQMCHTNQTRDTAMLLHLHHEPLLKLVTTTITT